LFPRENAAGGYAFGVEAPEYNIGHGSRRADAVVKSRELL
jgi:hypothetical protein